MFRRTSRKKCPGRRVQESEPVDDSYFDDVAFVGDSRTDGFRLYSGLERGTYFCVTGETVASATDMENWKTEDGEKSLWRTPWPQRTAARST